MATTEKYRVGQYVPAPVPDVLTGTPLAQAQALGNSATPAGTPFKIGILSVVTVSEKAANNLDYGNHAGEASVDLGGVHVLPVDITSAALTFGQQIYINTTTGKLQTSATGGVAFGAAISYGNAVANGVPVAVKIIN